MYYAKSRREDTDESFLKNMRIIRWIIAIMKRNIKSIPLSISYVIFTEVIEEISC